VKLVKELSPEQFDSLAIGLIKATHNTIDDLEVIEIDHGDDNIHANTVVCHFFYPCCFPQFHLLSKMIDYVRDDLYMPLKTLSCVFCVGNQTEQRVTGQNECIEGVSQ
jgi:hypothetical protein